MSAADKMSARQRARAARIEMTRKRAEKDRMIQDAAERFFKAEEAADQARALLDQCDLDRAAAVQELDALGLSASDTADMLDLDVKKVRGLRRAKVGGEESALEQDELPSTPSDDDPVRTTTAPAASTAPTSGLAS